MMSSAVIEKLKAELLGISENKNPMHVAVVMHPVPDPDCIGSAYGMKRIVKEWFPDSKVSLVYAGEISHPQNKTMNYVLNLQMTNVEEIEGGLKSKEDCENFADAFICVDCVPERCSVPAADYLFVVDHHKSDTKKAKIKDIRHVGACSSLVWEYMHEIGLELDKSNEEDSNVATALVVGIKTDTADLVTDIVQDLDFEAFKNLIGPMDQRNLAKIINYPIPPYYFELRKRLEEDGQVCSENGVFIGGIGYISPAKRDALPSIAEERARMDGVDTAFILAIVGGNLEVSVRSSGLAIDVDKIIKKIFGKTNGGGKMGAGAARIEMGEFSVQAEDDETQNEAWEFARKLWFARILKEMADHR
jgi:nanoRNase/pAp phosphatase (c-di-AMP/oligoRNAs hydrolase)